MLQVPSLGRYGWHFSTGTDPYDGTVDTLMLQVLTLGRDGWHISPGIDPMTVGLTFKRMYRSSDGTVDTLAQVPTLGRYSWHFSAGTNSGQNSWPFSEGIDPLTKSVSPAGAKTEGKK